MKDIEEIVPHIKKKCRSWSGVLVVTVVMRPDKFSCPFDCHYCPNEPGQPRSYLSSEPAVARANRNEFDPVKQFRSRLNMLRNNGHTINKIEIIVLGGTFSTYPRTYQEEFISGLFYASNTQDFDERPILSLVQEQHINETAKYRIIGISLETRPDLITRHELLRFRHLGCTRVQIGVQHTDNSILKLVNRGHTVETSIKAISLLRNFGFKIDVHIMPDLPGTTPDLDNQMMHDILCSPDFQPDYLKIYPCLDVQHTTIRNWKHNGFWKPYSEQHNGSQLLLDVCSHAKIYSKYWIRFNRIQRDFPEEKDGVIGYASDNIRSNFRQLLQNYCAKAGIFCKCIRCREVKNKKRQSYQFFTDKYFAADGFEFFISCASPDRTVLYGFVRLRLSSNNLHRSALIRELHVYGTLQNLHSKTTHSTQHQGIGKALMLHAEYIALTHRYFNIAVISGVGVREYYRKLGYSLSYTYMTKSFSFSSILFTFFRTFVLKTTLLF